MAEVKISELPELPRKDLSSGTIVAVVQGGTTYKLAAGLSLIAGGDTKESVRVAAITPLPANTVVSDVMTADSDGALPPIEGVTLVVGDRLLATAEATAQNNGWWTLTAVGGTTSRWSATRSEDANSDDKVTSGARSFIEEGTALTISKIAKLTNPDPITLGTTALTFELDEKVTPGGSDRSIQYNDGGTAFNGGTFEWSADGIAKMWQPAASTAATFTIRDNTDTLNRVQLYYHPDLGSKSTAEVYMRADDARVTCYDDSGNIALQTGYTQNGASPEFGYVRTFGTVPLKLASTLAGTLLAWPTADGSNGSVMVTDGAGSLYLSNGLLVTSGFVTVPNNTSIQAKTFGGSDANLLKLDASDNLHVGDAANVNDVFVDALSDIWLRIGGANKARLSSATLEAFFSNWFFNSSVVNPRIQHFDDATDSATGDTLAIRAQTCTGTNSNGGDLELAAGAGTSTDGDVVIKRGSTTELTIADGLADFQNNEIRTTGFVSINASGVASGALRLGNGERIKSETNGGADVDVLFLNSSDALVQGADSGILTTQTRAANEHQWTIGGTLELSLSPTVLNAQSNEIRTTGFVSVNGTGVSAGAIRLGNDNAIVSERGGGSDYQLLNFNSSDILELGDSTVARPVQIYGSSLKFLTAGSDTEMTITDGLADFDANEIRTTGIVSVSGTAVTSGAVRLGYNRYIITVNQAEDTQLWLAGSTGTNDLLFGSPNSTSTRVAGGTRVRLEAAGSAQVDVGNALVDCYDNEIRTTGFVNAGTHVLASSYVAVGADPAQSGAIRLEEYAGIRVRVTGADMEILGGSAAQVSVGSSAATVMGIYAGTKTQVWSGGSLDLEVSGSLVDCKDSTLKTIGYLEVGNSAAQAGDFRTANGFTARFRTSDSQDAAWVNCSGTDVTYGDATHVDDLTQVASTLITSKIGADSILEVRSGAIEAQRVIGFPATSVEDISGATTLTFSTNQKKRVRLTANATITIAKDSNIGSGRFTLEVDQNTYTVSWSGVDWGDAGAPTLSDKHLLTFDVDGSSVKGISNGGGFT